MKKLLLILPFLLVPVSVIAHSGGVDSSGGHFDNRTQKYHCHRVGCVPVPVPVPTSDPTVDTIKIAILY